MCLIEIMLTAGEVRCQEKAALEKGPANQTYILYNKDMHRLSKLSGANLC